MASRTIVVHLGRPVRRRVVVLSRETRQAVVLRWQILLKVDRGQPVAQVATAVGCDRSTVYRTLSAFVAEGERLLELKRSSGRPAKVKAKVIHALDQTLAKDPRAVGQIFSNWNARKLVSYLRLLVNAATILRHLRRLGWRWRRPVRRVASPDPRYGPKKGYIRRLRRGQQRQVDTPGQNQTRNVFGAVNALTGEWH